MRSLAAITALTVALSGCARVVYEQDGAAPGPDAIAADADGDAPEVPLGCTSDEECGAANACQEAGRCKDGECVQATVPACTANGEYKVLNLSPAPAGVVLESTTYRLDLTATPEFLPPMAGDDGVHEVLSP